MALDRSAFDSLAYQKTVARRLEKEAIAHMKASGVVLTYPNLERFVSIARPKVWDELAARLPNGRALLERLQKETGQ